MQFLDGSNFRAICSLVWGTMGAALNLGTRVPGNLRGKIYTALGSDGQGPHGFSFVFWILFDFSDLFTDLARACLGLLGASVELVVRPSTYGAHNRTAAL